MLITLTVLPSWEGNSQPLCGHRTMLLLMEQERTWCVSFQTWPIPTPHRHSPGSCSFCGWRQMGINVQNTWESERQEGLKGRMLVASAGLGVDSRCPLGVSLDYSKNNAFTIVFVLLPHRECHKVGEPFSLQLPFPQRGGRLAAPAAQQLQKIL